MEVKARPGEDVERLIKRFMKKVKQSGIDREWVERQSFRSRGEIKRRKQAVARRAQQGEQP